MLEYLPVEFNAGSGGGASFLNFVLNKNEHTWTDSYGHAEELLLLGLAIDKIQYAIPRPLWQVLPGSAPYVIIK